MVLRALSVVVAVAAGMCGGRAQTAEDTLALAQGEQVLDSIAIAPIAECEALGGEQAELCKSRAQRAAHVPHHADHFHRASCAQVSCGP